MSKDKVASQAKEHAERLISEIKAAEGAWDDVFRVAVVKNRFSRWMHERLNERELADRVSTTLNVEFNLSPEEAVSVDWWNHQQSDRIAGLIEEQDRCCSDIDRAKQELEAAQEAKKSAQATIDTEHSRLRNLAREIRKPYTFPLPPVPNRQRELPLADGEEWRLVPISDVLEDAALRSLVLDKLGNITLGQYTEEALKFGVGDRPKKLTRKQWDRVEEAVQEWHASRAEGDEDDADDDEEGDGGGL